MQMLIHSIRGMRNLGVRGEVHRKVASMQAT